MSETMLACQKTTIIAINPLHEAGIDFTAIKYIWILNNKQKTWAASGSWIIH